MQREMKLRLPKKKDPWTEDSDRQVQTRQSSCYERDQCCPLLQWMKRRRSKSATSAPQLKGAGVYDASNVAEFSVVTRTAKH